MKYTNEFLKFVNASPSPYHAVQNTVRTLVDAGYVELSERSQWNLQAGGRYYVTRNGSSVVAFAVGGKWKPGNGLAVIGAHTDSPCFRVKPESNRQKEGYLQVGVECYGGGLWPTWFDRDLGIAGRVYVAQNGKHVPKLVKIDRPLLRIPTIAIHLHREQGTKLEFNKEDQLEPILGLIKSSLGPKQDSQDSEKTDCVGVATMSSRHCPQLLEEIAKEIDVDPSAIEDFELVLFDTQPAVVGGLNNEFIFSPRLDNLNSSFCAIQGLINADKSVDSDSSIRAVALFDHEEIGSQSAQGAASNFLEAIVSRLASAGTNVPYEALAKSFLLSADMAHAIHPNYVGKHEARHRPAINGGPVIKVNANQRYATNSPGIVLLQEVAKQANVPLQLFVVRNDSACGSTIGPILASSLGLRTLDLGNPQLSMHSVRETGGSEDVGHAVNLFSAFFEHFTTIDGTIDV